MKTTTHIKRAVVGMTVVIAMLTASVVSANPVVEFSLATGSHPRGIVSGPDGKLWFTEQAGKIGRMGTDGSLTEFLTTGTNLTQIVVGPDNNLWFVEQTGNKIGRIKTNGTLTEFPTRCQPSGYITSGPHSSVWFAETCVGEEHISEMATIGAAAGSITEHTLGSTARGVTGIAIGTDGNVWFAEYVRNAMARLDISTGMVTEFSIPNASTDLAAVTRIPGDAIWFAFAEIIGRITSAGDVEEFDLPDDGQDINWITQAPDGSIWATAFDGALRRTVIASSGMSTEKYAIRSKDSLAHVTVGPDGNLWFTEYFGDRIGRIASDAIFFDGLGDTP